MITILPSKLELSKKELKKIKKSFSFNSTISSSSKIEKKNNNKSIRTSSQSNARYSRLNNNIELNRRNNIEHQNDITEQTRDEEEEINNIIINPPPVARVHLPRNNVPSEHLSTLPGSFELTREAVTINANMSSTTSNLQSNPRTMISNPNNTTMLSGSRLFNRATLFTDTQRPTSRGNLFYTQRRLTPSIIVDDLISTRNQQ